MTFQWFKHHVVFGTLFFLGILLLLKADDLLEKSRIDIIEKNEYKYDIDIHKTLKLQSDLSLEQSKLDQNEQKEEVVIMKNKFGQPYECSLPKFDDHLDEEEDALNAKKEGPTYNFTEIDEKIENAMGKLAKSKTCIYRSLGWWTYEFCFGSHASQYHMLTNGTIEGEIINLGNFTNDFNWLKAEETNFPISSGVLFHEQYFEMGTTCELSQQPRRGVAKIFCGEYSANEIELISEVETCVYEIHINSGYLCSIPNFREKKNNYSINCNPVIGEAAFKEYQAKKDKALMNIQEMSTKKGEQALTDINKASTVVKNAKTHIKKVKLATNENEAQKSSNNQEKPNTEIMKETLMKELKTAMKGIDKSKVDKSMLNLENIESLDLNDLEKINKNLLQSNNEILKTLRENGKVSKVTDTIDSMLSKIEQNLEVLKKNNLNLEKKENEISLNEKQTVENAAELDLKSEAEINEQIEQLKNELEEQDGTKNYKIKVIKLDPKNPNIDSDDLASMLSSMMKESSDSKNIERITSNYNYVYNEADEVAPEENNEEIQPQIPNKKNIKIEHISVANWLNSKDQKKSSEDDPENLIIF